MKELRFSEAREMFYDLLRSMFAKDIQTDEDAIFVKQLIDYILRVVDDVRVKGLEEKSIPIHYTSVWQSVELGSIFSIRQQSGITRNNENNISFLAKEFEKAFHNWGEETFDGFDDLAESESYGDYDETD